MIIDYQHLELDGKKVFERIVFQKFDRIPKVLENEACFLFLDKGSFNIRTQEQSFNLVPKDGFLTKCGDYFFEDINDQEEPIEALGIYFQEPVVKEIFNSVSAPWNKSLIGKVDVNPILDAYKTGILKYMMHPEIFSRDLMIVKIKELLLILAHSVQAPSIHHFLSSLFSRNELDMRNVIEKNMYSSLSIDQIAFLCGMSLATFKRRFQEIFQTSPAEFIRSKKLEKSVQLLLMPNTRISEIAYDSGFESISTFNRAFKSKFGVSPKDYAMSQSA